MIVLVLWSSLNQNDILYKARSCFLKIIFHLLIFLRLPFYHLDICVPYEAVCCDVDAQESVQNYRRGRFNENDVKDHLHFIGNHDWLKTATKSSVLILGKFKVLNLRRKVSKYGQSTVITL